VYVENVDGWNVHVDLEGDDSSKDESLSEMEDILLAILCGNPVDLENLMLQRLNGEVGHLHQLTASDVQDDIRQAFQDGLRQSISAWDSSVLGVELFMKSDTSQKKKKTNESSHYGVYNHFHVGMRCHDDAANLVRGMQGKSIKIHCHLPSPFVSLFTDNFNAACDKSAMPRVTITINKLFLDFADVLLPKRIRNTPSSDANQQQPISPGLPSRSECTSTTSHVHIPGLRLLPNFVSPDEEQVMLAVLTGPEAPWAPAQYTPSGGQIKRRVQHYGYVFDYESADVLRRGANDAKDVSSSCPPLPAVDMKIDDSDESLEEWIDRKVDERRGWQVLAGIIERTRRIDFTRYFEEDGLEEKESRAVEEQVGCLSLENNGSSFESVPEDSTNSDRIKQQTINQYSQSSPKNGTYPNINQLTINEYTPGQGIGSHVDTETAFDDGLLVITLNGGIVMEFRRVSQDIKKLVYLPPRSLILLSGDARYKWEHMIVSRTTDTVDGEVIPRKLRVSLTLRTALTAPIEGERAEPLNRFESAVFPPYWGQSADGGTKQMDCEEAAAIDRSDLITPSTESKHVHAVYDAIATQWHHTRGKRGVLWPGATQFLENLPRGSLVADVGCGDGKYFSAILGAGSYVIGTDISEALLRTASSSETNGGNKPGIKAGGGPQYQLLSHDKRTLSLHPAVAVADCIHLP
jgi:alkylated DNA repair dioxygenase AlkB